MYEFYVYSMILGLRALGSCNTTNLDCLMRIYIFVIAMHADTPTLSYMLI